LKNGVPKYVPQDALIEAFETAAAETTARIRAGLSLPASPDAKSSTSRSFWLGSRRRYGSEPPPSPSRRLLGMELPQPPLPPVAGELKLRLEALEMDAKRSHLQEVERIRGICTTLQEEMDLCRRTLEEKSRAEEQAQKELSRLRVEMEKLRYQRNDSKELLQLKEALSLLEQSDLEKTHRLQMAHDETSRLQSERETLETELRQLQAELRANELKERQLREKLESENKQEVFQRQRELQTLEADVRRLTESLERAEDDNRHLRKALKEREKAESELRDSLANVKGKAMQQKQQQIDQLSEENRGLKVLLQELEEEKGRYRGNERSQKEQVKSLEQDRQALRMKLQEALTSQEDLRREVSQLQREESKHLQAKQLLEKDIEHLRRALKQRRNAEKDLRDAIDEQKRLRAQSEDSTPSPQRAETRRTLVNVGLPGVPGNLQRTLRGRAVTLGELRPELMEVDLTSRMSSSKESSLVEVDMTQDL